MVSSLLQPGWGHYGGVPVSPFQLQSIQQGVRQGLSLNRIQTALRESGIGIRRSAIVAYRTELIGSQAKVSPLRSIRDDFRPSQRVITDTTIKLKQGFRVFGDVRVFHPETGERSIIKVNFGYQGDLTIGEIKSTLGDIAEPHASSLEVEIEDVQISVIQRYTGA